MLLVSKMDLAEECRHGHYFEHVATQAVHYVYFQLYIPPKAPSQATILPGATSAKLALQRTTRLFISRKRCGIYCLAY